MLTATQPDLPTSPVRTHVEMLHRLAQGVDGVLVVSVFNASLSHDKGIITHHRVGDVGGMVAAIEAHQGTVGANVYVGLQVMRSGLKRGLRGTEADIVAVLGLVADMDADTGKAAGPYPLPPNLVIETSPGNLQPMWTFDRPVAPAVAKAVARGLKTATGSDHGTADIAHVWRVPGTLNWPNATKLARGRSAEPAPVTVAEPWDGTLTDPAALAIAVGGHDTPGDAAPVTLDDLPEVDGIEVSPDAALLLAACDVGDRSAHAARVVEKLAFDGHPAEVAAALFLSASGDWLQRYASDVRARTDFARMWGRFGEPHAQAREAGEAMAANLKAKAANDNEPQSAEVSRKPPLFISSGDFVRGFRPPDYLLDGIMQSGFLYSLTGQTGAGKTAVALLLSACVAQGMPFAGRETKAGRVFYFAGENPDDVTMRWIGLCHALGLDADDLDVHFIRGVFDIDQFLDHIRAEADRLGGVGLIVVDTTAAYFLGTDENSNVEMGRYARLLRDLALLPPRPAVLAASHPVKNATADTLLPRGGGAFLNELDGNLTLAKRGDASSLHWLGKHRGPDFKPLLFDMKQVTAPGLVDSRGRDIPTVLASPVGEEEVAQRADAGNRDDDEILLAIRANGNRSLSDFAADLGWYSEDGKGDKQRAANATDRLKRQDLVQYAARVWKLTRKGVEVAGPIAERVHMRKSGERLAETVVSNRRGRAPRGKNRSGSSRSAA
ncbi:DNA primase RepB-like protein [Ancylobacter aquaticus]|uniref:DNA primase RepB-like protein n=1 Tax=Ancylobacter aquaticus TaxID=100 RepID=A0A4R1ID57_ANCAQ|nr:AAA family ATPase [Ancylobacter aquaticus]TCK31229.1 DNA primase RepB-like protein [Ancylobacter aquaticus]